MLLSEHQPLKRILILASGEGTLFEAIAKRCLAGEVAAEVVALITHKEGTGAEMKALGLGVPVIVVNPMDFSDTNDWDRQLFHALESLAPDLIVLAGFTKKLGPVVIEQFFGRIINSHPSLLPKFGGEGMYGRYVYEAILRAQESLTGITVHWVTENYDEGPPLAQLEVAVEPNDSIESLMTRVKAAEREFYPKVIDLLCQGQIEPLVETS